MFTDLSWYFFFLFFYSVTTVSRLFSWLSKDCSPDRDRLRKLLQMFSDVKFVSFIEQETRNKFWWKLCSLACLSPTIEKYFDGCSSMTWKNRLWVQGELLTLFANFSFVKFLFLASKIYLTSLMNVSTLKLWKLNPLLIKNDFRDGKSVYEINIQFLTVCGRSHQFTLEIPINLQCRCWWSSFITHSLD